MEGKLRVYRSSLSISRGRGYTATTEKQWLKKEKKQTQLLTGCDQISLECSTTCRVRELPSDLDLQAVTIAGEHKNINFSAVVLLWKAISIDTVTYGTCN